MANSHGREDDGDDRKEGLVLDHHGSAGYGASANDQADNNQADHGGNDSDKDHDNDDNDDNDNDDDKDDDDEEEGDACRLCRAGAAADRPLFHPCRCKGSIRHVHQDCLLDWLRRRPPRALDEATQAPVRRYARGILSSSNTVIISLFWRICHQRISCHRFMQRALWNDG